MSKLKYREMCTPDEIARAIEEHNNIRFEGLVSADQIVSITRDPNHRWYTVFWKEGD